MRYPNISNRAVVGEAGQGYYGSVAALREESVKFVQGGPEGRVGEPALGILRIFGAEPAPQAVPLREFPVGPGVLRVEVEVRGHGGRALHEGAGIGKMIEQPAAEHRVELTVRR